MFFRLNTVIRFAVAITNEVNPKYSADIRRRFQFPRQCTTFTLNANDSAEIKLNKLLDEVRNTKSIDAFQSLQIMRSCVNSTNDCVNREIVESIWAELKKKSEINEEHYLQLMRYYEGIKQTDEILMLFDETCALGLRLRASGYMMVLRAHLDKKNTKKAWKFLFDMEKANVCMDENSLHKVLVYFLGNRDYQLATKAIELIKERGFEMDFNALTKHWRIYARNGDIKSIQNSLDFFIKYKIRLRVGDLVELIYELSAHGYSQHVNSILLYLNNAKGIVKQEHDIINKYIEGGQSHILPKLMHAIGVDVDEYKPNLLSRMQYFGVPSHDFEQTKQNLQLISPSASLECGRMDSNELKYNEEKNVFQSEESQFQVLIRKRDCTGVEHLLERGNLNMTQQKYNAIIDLYIKEIQLEKALESFKKAITVEMSFRLSPNILIELVMFMVKEEHDFEQIKKLLKIHRKPKAVYRSNKLSSFFQQLADCGQAEMMNKLYDALVENNIVKEENLHAPLISVHLTNNDLNLAVDTYEKFVTAKNVAPYTVELMAFLIERNEMDLLRRVYEIYEGAISKDVAQYRLAFAYLKCGREEKARSILENVNMEKKKGFLLRECRALERLGKVEETEALLRLTKGLPFDRHLIYRTLLELHCKNEQLENIINLWKQYDADETVQPNKDFIGRLFYYLKKNKVKTSNSLLTKLENIFGSKQKKM